MSRRAGLAVVTVLIVLVGSGCSGDEGGASPTGSSGASTAGPATSVAPPRAIRATAGPNLAAPAPPPRLPLLAPGLAETEALARALGLGPAQASTGAFVAQAADGRHLRVLAEPGGSWQLTATRSLGGGTVATGCPPCPGPEPCAPCPIPPSPGGAGPLDAGGRARAEATGRRVAGATGLDAATTRVGSSPDGAVADIDLARGGARVDGGTVHLVVTESGLPASGHGPLVVTGAPEPEDGLDGGGVVARLASGGWVSCRDPAARPCPPDGAVVISAAPAYVLASGVPALQPAAELTLDSGATVVVPTRR